MLRVTVVIPRVVAGKRIPPVTLARRCRHCHHIFGAVTQDRFGTAVIAAVITIVSIFIAFAFTLQIPLCAFAGLGFLQGILISADFSSLIFIQQTEGSITAVNGHNRVAGGAFRLFTGVRKLNTEITGGFIADGNMITPAVCHLRGDIKIALSG